MHSNLPAKGADVYELGGTGDDLTIVFGAFGGIDTKPYTAINDM